MTDTLQSIKPLKSMAREDVSGAVLQSVTQNLHQALQKQVFSKEALRALQELLITIFFAFGLYVALIWWQLPLATILIMVFLMAKVLITLQKAQKEYQTHMIAESAYWSLLSKIEEAQRERETRDGVAAPIFEREIRFNGVDFSYERKKVLDNVHLAFPEGAFTVIIGPSGAGKTTIIDLITGLLSPQAGTVCVDGVPLTDLDVRQWRRMLGYVPQETLLLHDTVSNNVTLGDLTFTEMDVKRALRDAGALDFVADMPKGVHSVVGERGGRLSGGQRQRIIFARALVHRPQLLILDEATSSLDPASERAICETLLQLRGKLTILAISHQPALLDAADRAYRLHKGIARPVDDWATRGTAGLGAKRNGQEGIQPNHKRTVSLS
jgi:ATP-binding cassette subfamily C protein